MQAIAASERDEVFCAGVTEGQLKNSFEWLAMAARGGNVEAQSQFYVQALAKYESPQDLIGHADEVVVLKREAMQHLTHAAAAGNVQSIGALAVSGS